MSGMAAGGAESMPGRSMPIPMRVSSKPPTCNCLQVLQCKTLDGLPSMLQLSSLHLSSW